jgi:geranylgeranyl diphosphate synthase type I
MSETMALRDDPIAAAISLPSRVTAELADFLDEHTAFLLSIHADLGILANAARAAVLDGGKRLRPTFAYWGWRSVHPAQHPGEAELVRAAASLELLQACALVHDDVMDSSDTRRGKPAAHIKFAQLHLAEGWPAAAEGFGQAGAILLGDVLLSWAEEMFTAAIGKLPATRAAAATVHFDLMRTEVVAGQFLDLLAQTRGAFDPDEALRVIQYKTSKYTVERPLLLGAAAAGASLATAQLLSDYGAALGEAFQLRDDLLGVWGDPSETGKPAGDDLREGKRTLLVALAYAAGDADQQALLRASVGDPALTEAGVTDLRAVLRDTGARDEVERRIVRRAAEAAACLTGGSLGEQAEAALAELADAAAHRTF